MSTVNCVMADDQDEPTLDLTIEALTGTVYDLCVSPYETILGIKTKIQNLEGTHTHTHHTHTHTHTHTHVVLLLLWY